MKLVVDMNVCQGHARCWDLCPEVFDLDDEGHALVKIADVPPDLVDKVRDAVRNCPERAIELT
jgi:ferredoxin